MSVSLVQKTSQAGWSSTGVTTLPAYTAASTAGTTLVAVLVSLTPGTAFTQTTGAGWARRASAVGGVVRAELWSYEGNPGGVTAAQWTSGATWVNGEMSEWTGSGTVVLDGTPGTGTHTGGFASLALTNGSANVAGDVGVAVFADIFSGAQSGSSWTDPSGWSALGSSAATTQPYAWKGYYKTGLAAATLSVTGAYSVSAASTGWAGIVATFKDSVAGLAITTTSLAGGTVAAPYSAPLAAAGGATPYTWSISSGSLPGGLSLNASTGAISGTPSVAGTSSFTAKVADSLGATSTKALSIVVAAAAGRVAQLVGFDCVRGTWAAANATVGPGDTHRLFGSTLPSAFDADGTPSSVVVIQSYKTMNTNVASYCASVPGNRQVILIFHHEPENGDYALGSTFVSEFKSQSTLIRAQGRPNIRVAMCSSGYAYRDTSTADVLSGNYLRGLGAAVDLFTKDIYQGSAGTGGYGWPSNGLANYDQFQNWLNLVTDPSVVGTVQPLGITEYGVDDPVGNTARYNRIQLDHDYLVSAFSGGSASAFPLQCWCYWWEDPPAPDPNQSQFTDAATVGLWVSYETAATTPLAVATGAVPAATVGVAYTTTLTAAGGVPAYTWSVAAGALPGGLALAASTGVLSGTPTTPGVFTFTVLVTDTASSTDPQDLVLNVAASAAGLSVTTASLPDAAVGSAYSAALAATGGTTPYSWAVTAGSLPDGLALDGPSGAVSGAPVTAATSGFTVTVTDALGVAASAALYLTVVPDTAGGGYPPVYGAAYGAVLTAPAPAGSPALPQLIIEMGVSARAPAVPAGTVVLDDPVYGKLDSGNKLGDSTQWADITGYFRSGTISRPSSRVQGPLIAYQAGAGQAVLDSSDGSFDPDNPASPYVGAVRAMTPFRVRAVYGSATYPVLEAFTDGFAAAGVDYDAGYAETAVTVTDGMKVLAGRNISALPTPAGDAELSGARVTRILNAAGWYTDHRKIAAGDSPMQGATMGDSALSLLQLVADSEIGELYIDGAGNLVFRNRHAILTDARSTVPQAVFGDLPGTVQAAGTELAYASVGRANDDVPLANMVQATRVGGAEQVARSAASVRKNLFERTYSRGDLLLETDAETLGWAQWVLTVSLSPEDRFESLVIDPLADPANLFPQVLGREIGDRIQVWRRPQSFATPVTKDCFIRGIEHEVDAVAGTWLTTWTLQDASRYGGFLILGDPVNGKLNTAKLAF